MFSGVFSKKEAPLYAQGPGGALPVASRLASWVAVSFAVWLAAGAEAACGGPAKADIREATMAIAAMPPMASHFRGPIIAWRGGVQYGAEWGALVKSFTRGTETWKNETGHGVAQDGASDTA